MRTQAHWLIGVYSSNLWFNPQTAFTPHTTGNSFVLQMCVAWSWFSSGQTWEQSDLTLLLASPIQSNLPHCLLSCLHFFLKLSALNFTYLWLFTAFDCVTTATQAEIEVPPWEGSMKSSSHSFGLHHCINPFTSQQEHSLHQRDHRLWSTTPGVCHPSNNGSYLETSCKLIINQQIQKCSLCVCFTQYCWTNTKGYLAEKVSTLI